MNQSERLSKSIKEIDASLSRLEKMMGNLSHPRAQAIYQYEQNKSKIEDYARGSMPLPKSTMVSGTIQDRLLEIERSIKALENMVLQAIPGESNE